MVVYKSLSTKKNSCTPIIFSYHNLKMEAESYFVSDDPLRNQIFDDNDSIISYQDGCLSTYGGSSVNFSNSVAQMPYQSPQFVPGNININIVNNQTNSGASFDESSLITGVNSSVYKGSYSQGSRINRMDSLASISGPYNEDHLSVEGQSGLIPMPQLLVPSSQASVSPMMIKNPRLEIMRTYEQQISQMALWEALQIKRYNDCIMASRMLQNQRSPYQQLNAPVSNNINSRPLNHAATAVINAGLAVRRLMSYVHYRSQRAPDNNIDYWRSFVKHFYSPHIQKRTCFSNYAHITRHGVLSLAETWKCELCGSTSGKGFVETFDVLPRMNQLYFGSEVVDELLSLDLSIEKRLPDGSLMLSFEKAVQETIYMHYRVIQEGKLQVIFTPELKIISWDFCVQHHEVFFPRRLIASQVNEFVKSATRCKSKANAKGHDGVKEQNLPSNGQSRVAAAGRKLAATLEQPTVSDFGFSKHFVRSLQVSEVFNSMKDLIDDTIINNSSPIEALTRYGRKTADTKPEMRPMEFRSPMQQMPDEQRVHLGSKASNYMAHTPIINNRKAMYNSPSLYQNLPAVAEQMIPEMYLSPYNEAQTSIGPISALKSPNVEQLMLNDLLAHIQRDGTKQARQKHAKGKCNVVFDPNGEDSHIVHGGTQKKKIRLTKGKNSGNKSEIGKGFNSSSSSNQDCDFLKKETDLDEDFTSASQTQGLF